MKGHVRKRGNKWCFVVDLGKDPGTGKRRQKWYSGFSTKREAEKALSEMLAKLHRGDYVEPSRMSFGELIRTWLENRIKHNVSQKTYDTYKYLCETHIAPTIGIINLDKLSPLHLQKMYSDLISEEKLSNTTVHHIHRICYAVLKWAVQMKMIPQNVAENVAPPKRNKQEMKIWNEEEVVRFLSAAQDERLFALFFLAISTGLRRGELLGLKWSDVDFYRGVLSVRRTVQRTTNGLTVKEWTKTDSGRRQVNISPSTMDVLRQHRKQQTEEMVKLGMRNVDFIFTNTVGNLLEPRKVNHIFDRIIKKAEIPKIRFHDLRHTHATLLLKQGVHPKIVSERLGHASVNITLDTYSHVIPSLQKEAAAAIDQVLMINRKDTLSGTEKTLYQDKGLQSVCNRTYKIKKGLRKARLSWSGRPDLNRRPPGPKPGALPS